MTRNSRNTRQKELLAKEIVSFDSFFSADDVFKKVKKKDDSIGIATVYRFLRDAEHNHELHSYLCDRKTVFSKGKSNHCNFICERCGAMSHFNIDSVDSFRKKVQGDICHFQIEIHGICTNCLKK